MCMKFLLNQEIIYLSYDEYVNIQKKNLKNYFFSFNCINEFYDIQNKKSKYSVPLWLCIIIYNKRLCNMKIPIWLLPNEILKLIKYEKLNSNKVLELSNFCYEHFSIYNIKTRSLFNNQYFLIKLFLKTFRHLRIEKILQGFKNIKSQSCIILNNLTKSELSILKLFISSLIYFLNILSH